MIRMNAPFKLKRKLHQKVLRACGVNFVMVLQMISYVTIVLPIPFCKINQKNWQLFPSYYKSIGNILHRFSDDLINTLDDIVNFNWRATSDIDLKTPWNVFVYIP